MDKLTKEQRRKNMQAIKASGSRIEKTLARAIKAKGYKFKKNYSSVMGKPDIVLLSHKIAIFCDSEFWHGKDWAMKKKEIKSRRSFWIPKIERNIKRDKEVNLALRRRGWKVLRFWGTMIEKDVDKCVKKIYQVIRERKCQNIK